MSKIRYLIYIMGIVIVVALASVLYIYGFEYGGTLTGKNKWAGPVGSACPKITSYLRGSAYGSSGFSVYHLSYDNASIADYVIGKDASGTLYVAENIGNVTNKTVATSVYSLSDLRYALFVEESAPFMSTPTPPGLNVTSLIKDISWTENNTMNVNLSVIINTNILTPSRTYLVKIDTTCSGGVTPFLVTVGDAPYSGNITDNIGTAVI